MQVMQMFDKAEAEYRELSEKKRIVENDKDKIRKVGMSNPNAPELLSVSITCCPANANGSAPFPT